MTGPLSPAMLFDRDGTLTIDRGYTYKVDDLVWAPGAIEAIRACNEARWRVIVVTNQSGLARGYFTEPQMHAFHAAMQAQLAGHGARIDAFYFCPYHEDGVMPAWRVADHPDRKPNPGMLRRAMLEWSLDPKRCVMFGDTHADVAAARAAGIHGVHVEPGGLLEAVRAALAVEAPRDDIAGQALDALRARAATARSWLFDAAAPLWWSRGFDATHRIFQERLALDGAPLDALPRRVRVQARQTFVYAMLGRLGWTGPWREAVQAGVDVLCRAGIRADGGTTHLLSPHGAVVDPRRDLYDAAFVAFALAEASIALGRRADLVTAAAGVLDWVESQWAHPRGGFLEGDLSPTPPRRQNPHMHMLEACQALHAATAAPADLARAERLVTLAATHLIDQAAGALPEYFDEAWRRWPGPDGCIVEPGHQFEWCWLLHRQAAMGGADHLDLAERLRIHGEVYGVDVQTGVTLDEVDLNGAPRARTSRLWPHTERIKANLARYEHTGDVNAAVAAAQAFDVLQTYLDTPTRGLWRDRRAADGTFVDEPAPASSFYHIVLAYSELIRVAGVG